MTKQKILDQFRDINFAYNDCTKLDTLSAMLDELLESAQTARVMTLEEVKTQEPIEPIKHLSTGQICGSCKKVLLRKYKYCPACGKAVKWE